MRLNICTVIICLLFAAAVSEGNDSIPLSDTNVIAACASRSDAVAHVKVSSIAFVRKSTDTEVLDLSVYGRLLTLQVKRVYLVDGDPASFPTNIYIYRAGAMGGSFLEPTLKVGHEYLVFLNEGKAPAIVGEGIITDPPLPTTNYFTFVHLPQRQWAKRKAYVPITDTNDIVSLERSLSKVVVVRQRAKESPEH